MRKVKQRVIAFALLASLAACSEMEDEDVSENETTFAEFVIDLVSNTSDNTSPVDIQELALEETSNESAFDSLF